MARTTRASAVKANISTKRAGLPQLSSPPLTPASNSKGARESASFTPEVGHGSLVTPGASEKKRTRTSVKQEDDGDVNQLPHNLGTALPTSSANWEDYANAPAQKRAKRASKKEIPSEPNGGGVEVKQEDEEYQESATKKTPKKESAPKSAPKSTPKKDNYGLTPGTTPYPGYPRPTSEECYEIVRLLEKKHGHVVVPKAIPPPSLDVSGCGEVPSVLDALVRTRLSANTTNKNSSTAFQGLVARFGTLKEGIGKGSVDWDAVRRAPQKEVFEAIRRGGLADRKSKDIQAILQIAYEENQRRKAAFMNPSDNPVGAENEAESEKQEEISKAKQNIISLDHLHLLSTDDAINKMLTFPGIGPKTASCVALFCLQRPSFAVDTHVFRLCQYLGWVPKNTKKGEPKVDRNTTYSHCDVRIPDDLKYPLHQLLIKHGKTCPRCRAITGQTSAGWDEGCPIEHLVKRHGAKKGGVNVADRKKATQAAQVDGSVDDKLHTGEEDEGELGDMVSDDEEELSDEFEP